MSVINVRVANIRPKYDNLREWIDNSNHVYIGRAGIVFIDGQRYPKKSSIWANPFKINADNDRNDVLEKYELYIREILDNDPNMVKKLLKLKGKKLGCWCKPNRCHGDILFKLIDEYG